MVAPLSALTIVTVIVASIATKVTDRLPEKAMTAL